MTKTTWCLRFFFFLTVQLGVGQSVNRPNVILFLVDDLGWTDGGVLGSIEKSKPREKFRLC